MKKEHGFCFSIFSMIVFFAVPAVVDGGPSAVNVTAGSHIILKCRSSGDPVPKMRYVSELKGLLRFLTQLLSADFVALDFLFMKQLCRMGAI